MQLSLNGHIWSIAQLGPDFIILRNRIDHPPAIDTIRMAANRNGFAMDVEPAGSGEWRIRLRRRPSQEVTA